MREINADLRRTVQEMFELMYEANGVGLAANQVALPLRLFVMNPLADPEQPDQEFVFINPEIVRRKGSEEGEEGCLSLPGLYGPVCRAEQIVVEAFDLKGQGFQMELSELPGRVVQHEYDHIDGVLFIDRMTEAARQEVEEQVEEFETAFRQGQQEGRWQPDAELERALREQTA